MSGSGDARPSLSKLLSREDADSALVDAVRRWAPTGSDARVRDGAPEPVGPWPNEAWERATEEFGAWRHGRRQRDLEDRRLARRARDLDRLQRAGRRAAEARDLATLCDALGEDLADAGSPDCVQWIVQPPRGPLALRHAIARPIDEGSLEARAREAASSVGLALSESGASGSLRAWPVYDGSLEPRRRWPAKGRLQLPLLHRGRTLGVLAAYRDRPWSAAERRPYEALAAMASLHLERIWTVEAAEAGRFRAVLDAMDQAVFQIDAEGRLVHWNRAADRTRDEGGWVAGRPLRLLEGTPGAAAVDVVLRGKELVGRAEWNEGADRRLALTATALEPRAGSSGGAVLVLEDVTQRTRLQEQLAQSEKLSSLGQMLSGVAHELNNPLASILGYAQLLQMHAPPDEKLHVRLQTLRDEAGRCQKIVGNLLSFARRRPPEMRPFGLAETIRGVLQLMGYQLRTGGIDARLDVDPELPLAHGDDHQIQQVLVNLITNALHALESVEGERRLAVRTVHDAAGRVGFEVEDNGPGIPEDVRRRIFDPFYTTKGEGKGTGLGLSLVYGIVQTHRGSIEVEPGDEGGARFRVLLPSAASSAIEADPRFGASAGEPVPRATPPARILVVEDEQALRTMMREALESEGHRVASVADGRAALAALSMERFDLVLSDLRMPSMDGRRLVQSLERDHAELLDRLLLTTGDTLGTDAERFAGERGLPLLRKPFDLDELRLEVRRRLAVPEP